ncbi:MAG: CZB domain-containing protein [Nitrospirae bacterium]|nr:CZB domain-containing protein [Nitrospirota bacterium]
MSDYELMMFDLAKVDHMLWVTKIDNCLSEFCPEGGNYSTLSDYTICKFGVWYYGKGMKLFGNLSSFTAIDELHKKLHALGGDIISASGNGEKERAQRLFEELTILSHQLVNLLEVAKHDASSSLKSNPP